MPPLIPQKMLPSDGVLLMHLIILFLGYSLSSSFSPRPPSSTKLSLMHCFHHCCTLGLLGSTMGIPGQASLFPHPSFPFLLSFFSLALSLSFSLSASRAS